MSAIWAGRVKTTWKYSGGSRSSMRAGIQFRDAAPLTLRALAIAARVVGDVLMATLAAGRDMPTERGGAASLDRGHHPKLRQVQMPRVLMATLGARWPGRVLRSNIPRGVLVATLV